MSHLTDKAANGSNTNINNKKQTVTANGIVPNTNGGGSVAPVAKQTAAPTVNSTPSPAISFNSPSSNTDYNGGTQAEYEANFGNDSNEYLDEVLAQYQAAQKAQQAAIQAAVDQSVNSLNAQKATTTQDYADAYRQLYLNNMKSQKNIGQQMAAQGVTGGASESTLLGLNTNYEDNLREGKVAEQNALNELEQAIINAQLSGSIEAANTNATTAQNNANAYLTAWQNALTEQQMEASANSENRQYNYQMAMAMLQAGSMPSDQLLLNAGISKADAQTIVAQVAASKASSPSANNPTDTSWKNGLSSSGYYGVNEKGDSNKSEYQKEASDLAYIYSNNGGYIPGVLEQLNKDYTNGNISISTYKSLQNYYKNKA